MTKLKEYIENFNKTIELSSGYNFNEILKKEKLNFFNLKLEKEIGENIDLKKCLMFLEHSISCIFHPEFRENNNPANFHEEFIYMKLSE